MRRSTEMNVIPEPSRSQTLTASAGCGPSERTVIVNENAWPGATVFVSAVFVSFSDARPGPTLVVTFERLFVEFGSGVEEVTLAEL